ncbi:unnamed protein product [Amoebophrya sp. A120]|nr:unnamed protein product [Amoebophrya sp. A120]|eukprot:GSA120T00008692001.1
MTPTNVVLSDHIRSLADVRREAKKASGAVFCWWEEADRAQRWKKTGAATAEQKSSARTSRSRAVEKQHARRRDPSSSMGSRWRSKGQGATAHGSTTTEPRPNNATLAEQGPAATRSAAFSHLEVEQSVLTAGSSHDESSASLNEAIQELIRNEEHNESELVMQTEEEDKHKPTHLPNNIFLDGNCNTSSTSFALVDHAGQQDFSSSYQIDSALNESRIDFALLKKTIAEERERKTKCGAASQVLVRLPADGEENQRASTKMPSAATTSSSTTAGRVADAATDGGTGFNDASENMESLFPKKFISSAVVHSTAFEHVGSGPQELRAEEGRRTGREAAPVLVQGIQKNINAVEQQGVKMRSANALSTSSSSSQVAKTSGETSTTTTGALNKVSATKLSRRRSSSSAEEQINATPSPAAYSQRGMPQHAAKNAQQITSTQGQDSRPATLKNETDRQQILDTLGALNWSEKQAGASAGTTKRDLVHLPEESKNNKKFYNPNNYDAVVDHDDSFLNLSPARPAMRTNGGRLVVQHDRQMNNGTWSPRYEETPTLKQQWVLPAYEQQIPAELVSSSESRNSMLNHDCRWPQVGRANVDTKQEVVSRHLDAGQRRVAVQEQEEAEVDKERRFLGRNFDGVDNSYQQEEVLHYDKKKSHFFPAGCNKGAADHHDDVDSHLGLLPEDVGGCNLEDVPPTWPSSTSVVYFRKHRPQPKIANFLATSFDYENLQGGGGDAVFAGSTSRFLPEEDIKDEMYRGRPAGPPGFDNYYSGHDHDVNKNRVAIMTREVDRGGSYSQANEDPFTYDYREDHINATEIIGTTRSSQKLSHFHDILERHGRHK